VFSELPRFPCNSSKRPLTPHGFRDARPNVDTSGWELVGIPTGSVSGVDALDVDVEGMNWLTANIDKLPATRVQVTRSGGRHFFWKHAEGLRCSAGRIARGVDVRGDGGYVIDWNHQGYPTEVREIADWPDWILALAVKAPWESSMGNGHGDGGYLHGAFREAQPTGTGRTINLRIQICGGRKRSRFMTE
jgi:Bifunctional DNA primase/polymerase, N-terminal